MGSTAKDKLICLPNSLLRRPSKKVGFINDEIKRLAKVMQSVTLDWEDSREHEAGVALAAIQINQALKMVVVRNNFEDKKDRSFRVFINPRIIKHGRDVSEDFEGCLSIEGVYGKVPRYNQVKIKAQGIDGRAFQLTAKGFLARVLQHEIDHTKGVLFIDHIRGNAKAFFKLTKEGKIKPLNYEKDVEKNILLWT